MTPIATHRPRRHSLSAVAEQLVGSRRAADAVQITSLLWQQDPLAHWEVHVRCLSELRRYDAALHILGQVRELVANAAAVTSSVSGGSDPDTSSSGMKNRRMALLALHAAKMECCFEVGDSRGCISSAEAVLETASASRRRQVPRPAPAPLASSSLSSSTTNVNPAKVPLQNLPSGHAATLAAQQQLHQGSTMVDEEQPQDDFDDDQHHDVENGGGDNNDEDDGNGGEEDAVFRSLQVRALCFLGRCAERSSEAERATHCYREALALDPYCGSAMTLLMEHHLLQPQELLQVIQGLDFSPAAEPLRQEYLLRAGAAAIAHSPQSTVAASCAAAASASAARESFGRHRGSDSSPPPDVPPTRAHPDAEGNDRELPTKSTSTSSLLFQAASEHSRHRLREALQLVTSAREKAPYDADALCLQVSILVDMKNTSMLFDVAQTLIRQRGRAVLAVYAIGCYYFALANYERAGRYFSRATELQPLFPAAWVAFGHCYAKLEEGEQALAVYRRALQSFPGLFSCATFVGMQYSRVHSWKLSMCFLEDAQRMCPNDPLVLNEIAVLCLRNHQASHALGFLQRAVQQLDLQHCSEYRDCILFNLATVCRKQKDFEVALFYYQAYLRCRPNAAHGHAALAFTYHLMGQLGPAIAHYHSALAIKPEVFCRDMLDRALAAEFRQGGSGGWNATGNFSAAAAAARGISVGSEEEPVAYRGGGGGGGIPAAADQGFGGGRADRLGRSESTNSGTRVDFAAGGSLFRAPSPHDSVGRSLHF